jgi:RHS repeat-associated protein
MDSLGLYFYAASWYDPALGRFAQADTLIPGAGSSQAWDRYAYAMNNALRYIDPTGHFAQLFLGAAIGAVVGVALVAYTHPNLTTADYIQAAIVGAAAGTLISSGVGLGAGTALGATLLGAGAGAATSAGAYALTAGDGYSTSEMAGNALIGMATGAATALTGPAVLEAKVAGSFTAQAARAGINALGAQASLILNDQADNSPYPTGGGDLGGAAVGGYGFGFLAEGADSFVTGISGNKVAGSLTYNLVRSFSISTVQNNYLNFVDCIGENSCPESQ